MTRFTAIFEKIWAFDDPEPSSKVFDALTVGINECKMLNSETP